VACAASLGARAEPPARPELIFDAAPKQILFDWNYVPKANYYEIWFQANAGAAWSKLGERPSWNPHRDVNLSSHLLNWFDSRWDVRACNPSGCSAPRAIDIGSTVVNTVGYVKPQQTRADAAFGAAVDVSENGNTLAVVAGRERDIASTDPDSGTATVYVFRGNPNNWRQEIRLRPSVAQAGNGTDVTVSLSADGTLLALGVPTETFAIDGASAEHGAVYLFRKDSTGWHQEQRIAFDGEFDAPNVHLGKFVKLSDDGAKLVLSYDSTNTKSLVTYRHSGSSWEIVSLLGSLNHAQSEFNMSGDGNWLFIRWRDGTDARIETYDWVNHYLRDYMTLTLPAGYELSGFDVDNTGNTIASGVAPSFVNPTSYAPARWKPTVTVYRHDGTAYQAAGVLAPSKFQPTSYSKRSLFGERIAISGAGSYVAVYDPHDAWSTNGVQLPPTASYDWAARGSVYVFERRGAGYAERRHLGANGGSPDYIDGIGIFGAMAFGNDGKTFALAAPMEDGGIGGIRRAGDAETGDDSAPDAGAVWLY
jgi:hypothetical protein